MPTDIYDYAEIRQGGVWGKVGDAFDNPFFDPNHAAGEDNKPLEDHPLVWRSYQAFAFLADVRNYREVEPISKPRGLPPDVSAEVAAEAARWRGNGAYGHSWTSLRDLVEHKWPADSHANRLVSYTIPALLALIAPEPDVFPLLTAALLGDALAAKGLSDWLEENGKLRLDDVRMVFWFRESR
jgi:hypothetical protein